MTNTTVACTNINLLKESQVPASPSNTELYAIELAGKPLASLSGVTNVEVVSELPATPVTGVLYLIPEE